MSNNHLYFDNAMSRSEIVADNMATSIVEEGRRMLSAGRAQASQAAALALSLCLCVSADGQRWPLIGGFLRARLTAETNTKSGL